MAIQNKTLLHQTSFSLFLLSVRSQHDLRNSRYCEKSLWHWMRNKSNTTVHCCPSFANNTDSNSVPKFARELFQQNREIIKQQLAAHLFDPLADIKKQTACISSLCAHT